MPALFPHHMLCVPEQIRQKQKRHPDANGDQRRQNAFFSAHPRLFGRFADLHHCVNINKQWVHLQLRQHQTKQLPEAKAQKHCKNALQLSPADMQMVVFSVLGC